MLKPPVSSTQLIRVVLVSFFLIALLPRHPLAAELVPTMAVRATVGTVLAVERSSRTLLIDVALEKASLKLGGVVAGDAAVCYTKCGAEVSDFRPGDRVAVRWMTTAEGPQFVSVYAVESPTIRVNVVFKTVPGGVDIYFDGGRLGRSENDGRYVTHGFWKVGRHEVRALHPDYHPWENMYMVSRDKPDIEDTATLKKK